MRKILKTKNRYSFPGRILELIMSDDKYLQEILKIKKVENSFPRYDQWKDDAGLHFSFALAGFAPEHINISVTSGGMLSVSAEGLSDITETEASNMPRAISQVPKLKTDWPLTMDSDVADMSKLFIEEDASSMTEEQLLEAVSTILSLNKDAKTSVHKGSVSRGIARRSFKTTLYISEEFDITKAKSNMAHGLLNIFIPEVSVKEIKIVINEENENGT